MGLQNVTMLLHVITCFTAVIVCDASIANMKTPLNLLHLTDVSTDNVVTCTMSVLLNELGMYRTSGSNSGWLHIGPFLAIQFASGQNVEWNRILQPDILLT